MKSRYINGRFVRSLCLRLCQTFGSIFVLLLRLVRMETCVTHMFSACLVIQNASHSPSKRMHKNKIVSHGWLAVFVFRSFHSFVFSEYYSQEVTRSRCKNHSKDSNKNWATMEVKWKINLASKWKFQMEHNQQNVAAIRAILSLKFMPMPIHIPFHHSNAICISVCLIYARYLFYIARPFVLTYTRIFFHTFRQKTRRTKIFTFFSRFMLLLFYCRMALIVTSAICV